MTDPAQVMKVRLRVEAMDCASCANQNRKRFGARPRRYIWPHR